MTLLKTLTIRVVGENFEYDVKEDYRVGATEPTRPSPEPMTYEATVRRTVNVRSGAGLTNEVVKTLNPDEKVNVSSPVFVDGLTWWKIEDRDEYVAEYTHNFTPLISVPFNRENSVDVPFVSQLNASAPGTNDCGQACVAMLGRMLGHDISVHQLTNKKYGRTTALDLVKLGEYFNIRLQVKDINSANDVNIFPMILLGDYKELPFPVHLKNGNNIGLHWIVVTGYDPNEEVFFLNDPLYLYSSEGKRTCYKRYLQNYIHGYYGNAVILRDIKT